MPECTTHTSRHLWGLELQTKSGQKQFSLMLEFIHKGEFPVFKNHFLSEEDLLLRRHILQLMCNYQTSWKEAEAGLLAGALRRLADLEEDGSVKISAGHVKVTQKGKTFLRNICMYFDQRYWDKTIQTNVFSSSI